MVVFNSCFAFLYQLRYMCLRTCFDNGVLLNVINDETKDVCSSIIFTKWFIIFYYANGIIIQ